MNINRRLKPLIVLFTILLLSCGTTAENDDPKYSDLISSGWVKFTEKNYEEAISNFEAAKAINANLPNAFTGLGWSQLMRKEFSLAQTEFDQGIVLSDSIADLFAGKAFLLNARATGADLTNSITAVNKVLSLNMNWTFANGLTLDRIDLLVIKAQNQYLIGQAASALSSIKLVDSNFDTNTSTPEGMALLHAKIMSYNPSIL